MICYYILSSVAGGVMAVFLVVALAIYCYRQHVIGNNSSLYTQSGLNRAPHRPLYPPDHTPDLDTVEEDLIGK